MSPENSLVLTRRCVILEKLSVLLYNTTLIVPSILTYCAILYGFLFSRNSKYDSKTLNSDQSINGNRGFHNVRPLLLKEETAISERFLHSISDSARAR